jgi:hypothetical protein
MDLIEKNIIIVLGDLGSGVNFVKNVILLSPKVDFPFLINNTRLNFLTKTAYPSLLQQFPTQWLNQEYLLRSWEKHYDIDISDSFGDVNTAKVRTITQTKKIVFICHWPHVADQLKSMYPGINIVSLYASTPGEVEWQVSMYIEKLGIEKLHNFSFTENAEQQKQEYISSHGNQAYQKFNALNSYEIMLDRKDNYKNPDYIVVNISQLQSDEWIIPLAEKLNLTVDLAQAKELAATWRSRNPTQTKQWE